METGLFSRGWKHVLLALALGAGSAAMAADPQIAAFTDTPDPVPAGGVVSYTARIDNNAVDAALNTRLRVRIPAGASFVSATPGAPTCSLIAADTVECTLGTLGALGSDVRTVVTRWRANGPGPSSITATATVLAENDTNPDTSNNTQDNTTSVISGANLSLTKTDSPDPVVGGGLITYTITAANAGPNAGGDIVVTDTLPPDVVFDSADGPGWNCSHAAGVVRCTRAGPHPVGAAIPPLTVRGRVTATGGAVTNTARVEPDTGGVADPDTSDNTATADTTVLPGADVRIAEKVTLTPQPVVAGSEVRFAVRPRNSGPADATAVEVTDPLPAGFTFVSASGPGWACTEAAGTVRCTRATLPVGATDDITIVTTAPPSAGVDPAGQTFTNTATVSAASTDPTPGNNSGSATVQVRRDGADLNLGKVKLPSPVVALGSEMTSTIIVGNNGPRPATGPLRVVELLDGESFVSASGTGWACTLTRPTAPQLLVCEHPNTGGLPVAASLPTLTLITRAERAGEVINTACTGTSVPPTAAGSSALPPVEGDPNPTNDCGIASRTATTVQPDLALSKTTITPTGGDRIVSTSEAIVTYRLVVSNVSALEQPATGIVVRDVVPAFIDGRTTISSITVTPSAGSTARLSCTSSGAEVTCSQGGVGQLRRLETLTIDIVVSRPLQEGSFTNTATLQNLNEGDPNAANNSAQDTVTIAPIADIEMSGKTVSPASLRAGEIATYVLSFRNNGPSSAAAVRITDSFSFPGGDTGGTVVEITSTKPGSSCTIAAGAVLNPAASSFSCDIGALANGEAQSITLRLRVNFQPGNAGRTFGNTAVATTTTTENPAGGDNGNNSRSASITVQPAALDLLVNKTDLVDPVPYVNPADGRTFIDYRLDVTNNGPSFGTGVQVEETMLPPAGRRVGFVCDTATPGGACNPVPLCTGIGTVSLPGASLGPFACQVPAGSAATGAGVGELAPGASKSLFLRFEVLDQPSPSGDVYRNTARVRANEPDTLTTNDTENEPTTLRNRVDLRVSKAASVASPTLFQPFNWVVTVVNNGPGDALQANVTDTLPAGTELTGGITWTRTAAPGSGSCTASGLIVTCNTGQLNAGGTLTITIPVRVTSVPGGLTLTNSATIDANPDVTGAINLPGGFETGIGTVNLQRASLTGLVFEDRDRSGTNAGTPQAAGAEPRIAGVSMQLTGTDAYGNAVNITAITGSDGRYTFPNLAPSSPAGYTLTQTQPTGFINGPAAPPGSGAGSPSLGGSYSGGGTAGNSSYSGVVLAGSSTGADYNFPEVRRPTLSGFVYIDGNVDGVRTTPVADPPVAGATVRLLDADTGAEVATTTTDADGAYRFMALDPLRRYTVEQPLPTTPTGLFNGPVNPGLIGGAACASGCTAQPDTPTTGTDRIAGIDLTSGADGTVFNFGELRRASISGTVYLDRDGDGVIDVEPVDGRLPGVTLRLVQGADCTSGTTLATTTSGSDGSWRFDGVTAGGSYLVCQTQPVGYGEGSINPGTGGAVAGTNAIRIASLPVAGSPNNQFGERAGSIAGSVFLDANNNGVRDGGEGGIAGVLMTLVGIDASGSSVMREVSTDSTGAWRFDDLLATAGIGYTVTEQAAQPVVGGVTTLDGRTVAGSTGGVVRAVGTVPSGISSIPLPAGGASVNNLFAELLPARIDGTVFLDLNDDGLQAGAGEAGLGSVTINLSGTDDLAAPVSRTITTDSAGRYAFDGLRPGTYTVTEPAQPLGTNNGRTVAGSAGGTATPVSTTPSAVAGIVLVPGTAAVGNNFAELLQRSTLSGVVFQDRERGGADAGTPQAVGLEPRVPGVTVRLTGTDVFGNAVDRTAVTGADGRYTFADVPVSSPAGYTLTQTQPAGFNNGPAAPPASGAGAPSLGGAYAGGGTGGNSSYSGIVVSGSVAGTDYNFPELRRPSLAGVVYIDADVDGRLTSGTDPAIAGATVRLLDADTGAEIASTVTDGSGAYRFDNLEPLVRYTVEQPLPAAPAALLNGPVTPGLVDGAACATGCTAQPNTPAAGTDRIAGIDLSRGADGSAFNFGELRQATISGTVYLDRDGDGVPDAAPTDGRLPGVTLRLVTGADCTSGTTVATTTSGSDGRYRFDGAVAGASYLVCQSQPVGYGEGSVNPGSGGTAGGGNAIRIANLPIGGSSGNDFGERASSIAGVVFLDGNNNGLRDGADAGIGGVVVTLSGTDAAGNSVNRSTTTDGTGAWRFDDLLAAGPAGYAAVEQAAQPVVGGAATLNGRTSAGSTGGTATAVAATPSAITAIALPAGTASVEHRFAEILPARLDGTVFIDVNDDGLQAGAPETGLPGVTINLSGTDDTGAAVTRSVTTDASGRYAFEGLRPGTYTVTEPVQPVGTIDGRTVPGSAGGSGTPVGTTPSAVSGVVLVPGTAAVGNNFAEAPSNLQIGGRVWLDGNADGTLGSGETGIARVTIELSGTDLAGRPVSRSTVTGADGSFLFDGLAPGTYRLVEPAQPAGTVNGATLPGRVDGTVVGSATPIGTTPSAIGDILLAVGQSSVDNLFGEVPGAAIEGLVYADNDGDGISDAGESGFPGVTIVLTGTDNLGNPVTLTTVTGADGRWVFEGLRPGTYTVTQPTQPAGAVDGITSAGSAGGTATAAGSAPATPSAIASIVLGPGVRSSGNRFGELAESPDLRVSKRLVEPRLTVGFGGSYRISVRNVGERATVGPFTVRDRLPTGLVLAAAPTGTGFSCSGVAGEAALSCTSSTVLAAGATLADEITVNVRVTATTAGTLNNAVLVEGGGEIEARGPSAAERAAFAGDVTALPVCGAVPAANACRTPTPVQLAAALSGSVWHDVGGSTRLRDGGDRPLGRWQVEVVDAAGTVVGRATTGSDGRYRIEGLEPGVPLTVRFRDPDSGVLFAAPVNGETAPGSSGATCNPAVPIGTASSCAGSVTQPNLAVVLAPGQELREQSLPVDPSGVVYDSGTRVPVPGSVVTLAPVGACSGWNPATGLVGAGGGGFHVDGGRVSMTVGADGFYQFLFTGAAPASCTWGLTVTPPSGWRFESTAIPPQPGVLTPPGAAGSVFNVQPQAGPPSAAVGPGTVYHLQFVSGSAGVNVLHNHIPLDPELPASLALSKTGDRQQAEVGDGVRYTVTVAANPGGPRARQTTVVDRLPAGFTYIPGTATVNDRRIADPAGGVGPTLAFHLGEMPASGQLVLRYRLRVGVGAAQGDGVNRAQAHSCGVPAGCVDARFSPLLGSVGSNQAQYRVRVSGGVFTTEACVLGKIFVDCNGNHVQDREELGIPGVRLVMQDGTTFVSDSEGKYGICGLPPRSHVLKVDQFTLPRGARLTTSSNRNLGDGNSLWLDLKNGELHRADFVEGSCSNTVLEQVKARRAQGEVRGPETERKGGPALRFDSKAHGLDTQRSPQQGTDGVNQRAPKPRMPAKVPAKPGQGDDNVPTPELPMNRPPPKGRDSGQASDAANRRACGQRPSFRRRAMRLRRLLLPSMLALAAAQALAQSSPATRPPAGSPSDVRYTELTGGIGGAALHPRAPDQDASPPRLLRSDAAAKAVARIIVEVDRDAVPADGQAAVELSLQLLDKAGQPLTAAVMVTIEWSGGRLLLNGARTDEAGPRGLDADPVTPGVQLRVEGGQARLTLLAPHEAQDVRVRVSAGPEEAAGTISFVPDRRPMVAAGLVEGIVSLRSRPQINPVRRGDPFEQEIERWSREFRDGRGAVAARTAFYLKGTIRGDLLLTAAYDSDKDTRARLLRDIRPDELYPVLGDASLRSFDARSGERLYVRIDKDKSYALFGDFVTGDGFSQPIGQGAVASLKQRSLGNVNRTATGARLHHEQAGLVGNLFAFRDTLRQVVEEIASQGSGPYGLRNNAVLEGSEKVEVIVRDRNQPSRIVSVRPLVRLVDYSFEPFSGRILLASFLPAVDADLNPVSLRISYEVDQGGEPFWVGGGDVQWRLNEKVELGGSLLHDRNALAPYDLVSANATLRLGPRTALVVEAAQTTSTVNTNPTNGSTAPGLAGVVGEIDGRAARLELVHEGERADARVFWGRSSPWFNNPGAPLAGGREELFAGGGYKLTERLKLLGEAARSEDRNAGGGERSLLGAALSWAATERLTLQLGLRQQQELIGSRPNGGLSWPYDQTRGLSSSLASGSGGGVLGFGNQTLDPATGLPVINSGGFTPATTSLAAGTELESTSVRLGAGLRVDERTQLGAEVESSVDGDRRSRLALGAEREVAERTRLYGRWERQSGWVQLGGVSDVDRSAGALSLGVDSTYFRDTQLFSEYRLRDAIAGRDLQLASGIRQQWSLAEGWRANGFVERLRVISGATAPVQAIGGGLEWTAHPLWRGTARAELRRSGDIGATPDNEEFQTTLLQGLLARKLSRDWTLLARNHTLLTDYAARGDVLQNRAQLGLAWRDTDTNRSNALARIEYKTERDASNAAVGTLRSRAWITSLHADHHPSRPWWLSGRIAGKWQRDQFEAGATDAFRAALVSGRVVYDIGERWDIGAMASAQFGQRGARQTAWGAEVGYLVQTNVWLSGGFNVSGFAGDADLVGYEYTRRGAYIRLRIKFDEDVFRSRNRDVNRSLDR